MTSPTIVQGTCRFEANDRTKYSKVVAYWQDRDRAERVEIETDADAEGDSVFRLPEPYADAAEADRAAQAKDLQRGKGSASVTIIGDTSVVAGAPLIFSGIRPGLDGVPYIIETVEHEYGKGSGFRTKIDARLYDGKSTGGGSGGNSDGSGSAGGSVAPDAPAGTPATPPQFKAPRTSGQTDAN